MIAALELKRLALQGTLDDAKTQQERNRLGQFGTPIDLAKDVLRFAKSIMPRGAKVSFLDPAFGTGSFYSALLSVFSQSSIRSARGFEIDAHYGQDAIELWRDTPLSLEIKDFTKLTRPQDESDKPNLIVCNPPYVRHHHLHPDDKLRLHKVSLESAGVNLSGLAGLYCHFLCISHAWLARSGYAVWLIPSEFMDVNYGRPIKEYLLNTVSLLRIHRFDPAESQFADALVSSAIVIFQNKTPKTDHLVDFTFGGRLTKPHLTTSIARHSLSRAGKWTGLVFKSSEPQPKTVLSDLFTIKRGIATGANGFFIMTHEQAKERGIPEAFLKPILPSPRYLDVPEIQADSKGNPLIQKQQFLLDCNLPPEDLKARCPALWAYLLHGEEEGISSGYLCTHRSPWYSQEQREPAPLLCTYMGRNDSGEGAFRFILNHSQARAANVYLLIYPKPHLARLLVDQPALLKQIWLALSQLTPESLLSVGRVYGGGLHKMEPKELANAPADSLWPLLPDLCHQQGLLF